MDFVHYDLGQVSGGQIATIQVREPANVRLMDHTNFQRYQRGERFSFTGGQALRSPVRLAIPAAGHWHIVLDLGGATGTIHHSLTLS